MDKIKIANKGYSIIVDSWENDGDNSRTETVTYEDKELATAVYNMCKELFCSRNNGKGGVGNSMDGNSYDTVIEYMKDHPILTKGCDMEDVDYCFDLSYELMGGSECYDFRVCEKVTMYYCKEDVYSD